MKQPLQSKKLFAALLLFLVTLGAFAQTTSFTITASQTPAQCPGTGRLTFSVLTGLDPLATLTFTVYQGNGTGGAVVGTILTPPYELPNLNEGQYTVVATQTLVGGASSNSTPFPITIGSTSQRPTYRPDILGVRCANDGRVTIITLTGSADTYSLYSANGATLISGPQASPTFSNLGVGTYVVRAENRCGDSRDITVPIIQETTDIFINPYVWPYLNPMFFPDYYELDSCNTITVETLFTATAPAIMFYPLTLTYTVTSPTGVVTVVTQTVTTGTGQTPLNTANIVSAPLPFYHDVDYYYDLLVTDVCGNTWNRNDNLIHETYTVLSGPVYDHCDEVVGFEVQNYVAPLTVRFVSFAPLPVDPSDPNPPTPGSFDVVTDPILHNPNHPTFPAGPISYGDHMPPGSYCVEITDSCGRVGTTCFLIDPPVQDLILNSIAECNAPDAQIEAQWARSITDFVQVHIIPPYPTGVTLPPYFDTSLPFIDASEGIDPQTPSNFLWPLAGPYLPFATYRVEAVNECGETFTGDVTLVAGGTARPIAFNSRPGCDVGYGSVQVYQEPLAQPQDIAAVKILSSTSPIWTAANPAAVDVSANLAPNNGIFYMNSLPEGSYEFEVTNSNGCIVIKTVVVTGYRFTTKTATTTRDCTTFTATIDVQGANPGTVPSYWLQKWDATLNDWVHPTTNVPYPAGSVPIGQTINTTPGAADNSVLLVGPSTNNGVYTPGQNALYGAGDFRVIEVFSIFGNGVSSGQRCVTTLATVTQGGAPVITGVFSFPCSSTASGEAIVSATGFTNAATPDLLYSIIAKQGDPLFVPVGPQTSNIFGNLDANVGYTFSVTDACGTTTQVAQVQPAATMAITASGTCLPFNLNIPEYQFLDYEWFNVNDPSTILSTTGELNVTTAGTYTVNVINPGNPTSCLNQPYTQVVNASVLPNAGTVAPQPAICTNATAQPVNLLDYLTGEDTIGGLFTQSASTPGGVLTGTEFDISTITTSGTFDFTYTVTDSCGNTAVANITVTTTESPVVPTVNVLPVQCEGTPFSLTATSTTPGVIYEWTLPNGTLFTGAQINFTGAVSEGGVYSVVAISADRSCTSASVPTTVTVLAAPNAGDDGSDSVCNLPGGVVLTLSNYIGTHDVGAGTWTDDDSVGGLTGEDFSTNNVAPGVYHFTYSVVACGITDTATVTITVKATPAKPVATAALTTVCEVNGSINLSTPVVTNASYEWFKNGTLITGAINDTYVISSATLADAADYSVTLIVDGCVSPVSDVVTITVTPLPQFTLSPDAIVCPGQQATIAVAPTNSSFNLTDTNITYTWYADGVVQPQHTTASITVSTAVDVTYSVEVTNTNGGCTSPQQSSDLEIDTNPFTVVLQSDCVGDHLVLSIANIDEIGATQSIVWSGGASQGGNSAELDITESNGVKGDYTVVVTNANGCVKTESVDIQSLHCMIPKGISPDLVDDKNDFFDLTNLKVENLQIFNRYGLQVYEKNNYTKEWNGQSDKGDLPTGTYFYVAKMPGRQVTGWVYIQRNSN